jgi:cytoskeletal protein RodZ
MQTQKESSSFGYYLQSIRLEKNITLETVAEETRIAISNLTLIEKEDIASLPDPVFVKGFLRSYAQAIGADPNEAVRLYEARFNMKSRLDDAERFTPRSTFSPWRNLILSIIVVVGLIALSLYGVSYYQHRVMPLESVETSAGSDLAPATRSADLSSSDAQTKTPSETAAKLELHITALEETWVKIIVDNQEPKEYNLRSGEQLEEKATVGYNLLIGNASGLALKLNGEPVEISGKEGEVVNIQLPNNE